MLTKTLSIFESASELSPSFINTASVKSISIKLWPGMLICGLAAIAAQFLSFHYGAPAMLLALLLGLALQSATVGAERVSKGIAFSSSTLLRLGVGLLGARISIDAILAMGMGAVWLVVSSILVTTSLSFVLARMLGRRWRLAVLTGGAVSICGASAAIAIAAILPRNEHSDRNLSFTVFSVTLLSTIAMIAYPIIGHGLDLSDRDMGLFLGGTIHDVAQVVGAGFSVSETVGEASTTIKLLRVSMLAPFVMVLSIALVLLELNRGESSAGRPTIIPW
ncbi:MAG: putative sulfate exporter family transporter, partial [Pseudomonadota bacterium]